jgi:hypothetical protein
MSRGIEVLTSANMVDLTGAGRSPRKPGDPMGVVATGRFAHEPLTAPEPVTNPASNTTQSMRAKQAEQELLKKSRK